MNITNKYIIFRILYLVREKRKARGLPAVFIITHNINVQTNNLNTPNRINMH